MSTQKELASWLFQFINPSLPRKQRRALSLTMAKAARKARTSIEELHTHLMMALERKQNSDV